jgi:hypothetical protein
MQGCLLGLEFSGLDSSNQRVMGLLSAKGKNFVVFITFKKEKLLFFFF